MLHGHYAPGWGPRSGTFPLPAFLLDSYCVGKGREGAKTPEGQRKLKGALVCHNILLLYFCQFLAKVKKVERAGHSLAGRPFGKCSTIP